MLAIYCRISKNKAEGKDVSIYNQQQEGIKFANSMSLEYSIYVDEGISGTKEDISERPDFARMVGDIKDGKISHVYCFDQSRIERNNNIWNLFVHFMNKAKCCYYPQGQYLDLNKPENKLFTGVMSLVNSFYSELTGQKVKMAINENAKNGKSHGLTAFGYRRGADGLLEKDPDQGEVVEKMFKLSNDGVGVYSIAKILNQDKTPTRFNEFKGEMKRTDKYTNDITLFPKNKVVWRGNVVHDILKNTIYKGKRKWNGQYYDVPAIVSNDLWEKVNHNFEKNKKNVGRRTEYKYLLNGLVFCEDCGSEFKGKKRLKGNDNAYKCKGKSRAHINCTSRGISLPKLETFIIKHLFVSKELQRLINKLPTSSGNVTTYEKKLDELYKKLNRNKIIEANIYEQLFDPDYKNDEVIKAKYKQIKSTIRETEENIEAAQQKVAEYNNSQRLIRVNNLIDDYKVDAGFDEIKRLVHSLIKRITIKHVPKEKSGYYLLNIEYRGFDESTIFMTNWNAFKWYCTNYYRSKAGSKEQLEDDKEMFRSLLKRQGIETDVPDDFEGFETITSGEDLSIEFSKEDLINFD